MKQSDFATAVGLTGFVLLCVILGLLISTCAGCAAVKTTQPLATVAAQTQMYAAIEAQAKMLNGLNNDFENLLKNVNIRGDDVGGDKTEGDKAGGDVNKTHEVSQGAGLQYQSNNDPLYTVLLVGIIAIILGVQEYFAYKKDIAK